MSIGPAENPRDKRKIICKPFPFRVVLCPRRRVNKKRPITHSGVITQEEFDVKKKQLLGL